MNAAPMLTRCFNAQWRGLPAWERFRLQEAWAEPTLTSASVLHSAPITPVDTGVDVPLWQVAMGLRCLNLVSLKEG